MTAGADSCVVRLTDESGVGEARRAARRAAQELGLGQVEAEQAAIVAAEASRNVILHARRGLLLATAASAGGALDILALDQGPGIPDVQRALQDGFSTVGTAGQGLGAIARLASVFDLYSLPGRGSALFARVGAPGAGVHAEAGAVCAAVSPEPVCGDAWAILERPSGRAVVLVADGLGHGRLAAEAAHAAVSVFRRSQDPTLPGVLEAVHAALRPTRGAAVAVAEAIDPADGVRYAGIGNISGVVLGSPQVKKMVSLPGIAGHEARKIRAFDYPWAPGGLLVMHSDGVASHWDLADYPGLVQRHPALVAGVLFRDFSRGRDDATVVVVRRGDR
jgi:anti-sigma regulatory factor (Ser/Thr protein kinase)